MFNGKQTLVFIFFLFENMAKTIELSFFRKNVLVLFCVMLPSCLYGALLFLGNNSSQFKVCGKMNRVIILKDMQRCTFASIGDLGVEFDSDMGSASQLIHAASGNGWMRGRLLLAASHSS